MSVARPTMLARTARMRKEPTEAERRLWGRLRASQLGQKFRRQAVIDERIVDFFCPAKGLIVEIDGDTHEAEQDRARDVWMSAAHEFTTLRFHNGDVLANMEGVLQTLLTRLAILSDRWPGSTTPDPSSKEEGSIK
jgi:very-short-patch-repair endonuclease